MELFASLLLLVSFSGVYGKVCDKQADCGEGECCLKKWPFSSPKCSRRKVESQSCVQMIPTSLFGDIYLFHCPCEKEFRCKTHQSVGKLGILFFSPKCVPSIKVIPEEPDTIVDDGLESELESGINNPEDEIPIIDGLFGAPDLDMRAGAGEVESVETGLEMNGGEVERSKTEVGDKMDKEVKAEDRDSGKEEEDDENDDKELEKKDDDESGENSVEPVLEEKGKESVEKTGKEKDKELDLEKETSENEEPRLEEKVDKSKSKEPDLEEKVPEELMPDLEEKVHVEVVTELPVPEIEVNNSEREINEDELPVAVPIEGE